MHLRPLRSLSTIMEQSLVATIMRRVIEAIILEATVTEVMKNVIKVGEGKNMTMAIARYELVNGFQRPQLTFVWIRRGPHSPLRSFGFTPTLPVHPKDQQSFG